MIRFLTRSLGLWILAGAFFIVVYDGTISIAGSTFNFTRLEGLWNLIYSKPLEAVLKPLIDRYVGQWLWDAAFYPVLHAPACVIFGVVGAALMLLGRKKKPLIGYARR
jgi:hypothetical protein